MLLSKFREKKNIDCMINQHIVIIQFSTDNNKKTVNENSYRMEF